MSKQKRRVNPARIIIYVAIIFLIVKLLGINKLNRVPADIEIEKQYNCGNIAASRLMEIYSHQITAHVGPVVSVFFGLLGILIVLSQVNSTLAKAFLSLGYFTLGIVGVYFYGRLMYFGKLAENAAGYLGLANSHQTIKNNVLKKSKLLTLVAGLSESEVEGYNLNWAWIMLAIATVVAFTFWYVIFFDL